MFQISIGERAYLLYGLFYSDTTYENIRSILLQDTSNYHNYRSYPYRLYPVKLILTGPKEEIKAILAALQSNNWFNLPALYLNDRPIRELEISGLYNYCDRSEEKSLQTLLPSVKFYKNPLYGTYIGQYINSYDITKVINKSFNKEDQLYRIVKKNCNTPFLEQWKKYLWNFLEENNYILKIPEISIEKIDFHYYLNCPLSFLEQKVQDFLEEYLCDIYPSPLLSGLNV